MHFQFSVQYRRDELVRRDNIVDQIEWDDDAIGRNVDAHHRVGIRTIGLKLAYVARIGLNADVEGRIFEVLMMQISLSFFLIKII